MHENFQDHITIQLRILQTNGNNTMKIILFSFHKTQSQNFADRTSVNSVPSIPVHISAA